MRDAEARHAEEQTRALAELAETTAELAETEYGKLLARRAGLQERLRDLAAEDPGARQRGALARDAADRVSSARRRWQRDFEQASNAAQQALSDRDRPEFERQARRQERLRRALRQLQDVPTAEDVEAELVRIRNELRAAEE
jgi:hypothetical protein